MVVLLNLLSRLPLAVLYPMADGLAFLARRVFRYRRPLVVRNLRRAFPEKSSAEIRVITHDFYRNLTDVIIETLKSLTIRERSLRKRVTFHRQELVEAYYRQGQSVILLTTHQCNWEWLLLAGCSYLSHPVDAVYKPLANKKMDTLMHQTRARFGGQPISKDRVLREVLRRQDQVRAIAIVADQTPAPGTPKHWIEFLHQDTGFYRGIEQLPQAVQFPVFFVKMIRTRRGHYDVSFVELGTPPYEKQELTILPQYVKQAEMLIQEQPANWLWSHDRWKYTRPKRASED